MFIIMELISHDQLITYSATPPIRHRVTVLLNYLLKHSICLSNSSPRHSRLHASRTASIVSGSFSA
ncbi:hypothetical protein Hanom_Chr11g00984571 [Helianthus anomalus]